MDVLPQIYDGAIEEIITGECMISYQGHIYSNLYYAVVIIIIMSAWLS